MNEKVRVRRSRKRAKQRREQSAENVKLLEREMIVAQMRRRLGSDQVSLMSLFILFWNLPGLFVVALFHSNYLVLIQND